MLGSWMLYSVLVGALIGAAALSVERGLQDRRVATRWVWLFAMGASLVLPLVTLLLARSPLVPPASTSLVPVMGPLTVTLGVVDGLEDRALPLLERLQAPLLRFWALATVGLLGLLALSFVRLAGARSRWRKETVDGTGVLVSADVGPAVLGIFRHDIVLPSWVLASGAESRSLILAHEREHVLARDPLLVLAGALPAVLLPWHLPLWWQLRRLRLAVEVDCDRRVLGRATPGARRRYPHLLLEVGRSTGAARMLAAAFSEKRSFLEHRIRGIVREPPAHPGRRAAGLGAVGALLVVTACLFPGPDGGSLTAPEATEEIVASATSAGPVFTPYTVAPDILNRAEVQSALEREYPPLLRDAGIGGRAQVWLHLDETGRVTDTRIDRTSGHVELDRAAMAVAGVMRFSPALNRDRPTPVWVSLPISFRAGDAAASGEGDELDPRARMRQAEASLRRTAEALEGEITRRRAAGPTFTPYTVAPDITNRAEVERALEGAYPPLLKDAGIGGSTQVWFYIEATGRVADLRVNKGSGNEQLDQAALAVARAMRFTAATNSGEPVPVWVSLPITFRVR